MLKNKIYRKNKLVIVMLHSISEYAHCFDKIKNLPKLLLGMAKAPRLSSIFHLPPFTVKDQKEWQRVLKKLITLANREQ
jgi:hypothetical protein